MGDDNTTIETWYSLDAKTMASQEAFCADAEDRNIARGCTCKMPTYRHYFDKWPIVRCYIEHTDTDCPRRPS